jgi:hypothetical protein
MTYIRTHLVLLNFRLEMGSSVLDGLTKPARPIDPRDLESVMIGIHNEISQISLDSIFEIHCDTQT